MSSVTRTALRRIGPRQASRCRRRRPGRSCMHGCGRGSVGSAERSVCGSREAKASHLPLRVSATKALSKKSPGTGTPPEWARFATTEVHRLQGNTPARLTRLGRSRRTRLPADELKSTTDPSERMATAKLSVAGRAPALVGLTCTVGCLARSRRKSSEYGLGRPGRIRPRSCQRG